MTCQSCGVGDEGAGSGKPRFKTFVLVPWRSAQRSDRRNDRGTLKWATTFSELFQHIQLLHLYENGVGD
jgi:hypothetical protein